MTNVSAIQAAMDAGDIPAIAEELAAERVDVSRGLDESVCVCGNGPSYGGFWPCTDAGVTIPFSQEQTHFVCIECGRVAENAGAVVARVDPNKLTDPEDLG